MPPLPSLHTAVTSEGLATTIILLKIKIMFSSKLSAEPSLIIKRSMFVRKEERAVHLVQLTAPPLG